MHPNLAKLFLNGVELKKEKSIVDHYKIKNGDVIISLK